MWIITLLFGFGLGGLCEYFRRERELRLLQKDTNVGNPSASQKSESAQFNCRACCSETPMNWIYCPVCGRRLR